MGVGRPEEFRARVYVVDETFEERHARHIETVKRDAQTASGFIEAPAYDAAIFELVATGFLDPVPTFEPWPGPEGGTVRVWRAKT